MMWKILSLYILQKKKKTNENSKDMAKWPYGALGNE